MKVWNGRKRATARPGVLALIVPHLLVGRLCHIHLKLIDLVYRDDERLPLAGITVLQDRDCLVYRVDGAVHRVFYDAFTSPRMRAYDGEPLDCAYCRQPIAPGMPAVRCPNCAIVFHQGDEMGCWLATEACPSCGHPTALAREPTWTPRGFVGHAQEVEHDLLTS